MINISEVFETNRMIQKESFDVRTITMGISLMDCIAPDLHTTRSRIREKILSRASKLVETGDEIGLEYGVPIVNKRISVTPISLVGAACCRRTEDYAAIARTLDECAKIVGVNFIGGFSALVSGGMTRADILLMESIPEALAGTERVCSVGLDMIAVPGSTKASTISGIIADEMALGMMNQKTRGRSSQRI